MSPLRIIVIAILLYIGFRLIFGGRKKQSGKQSTQNRPSDDYSTNDVLVEDPVCHSLVPKQQAVTWQHGEEVYHFCSQECCNTFIAQQGEQ